MTLNDQLSVLLIEDEPIWAAALELYLKDFGFPLAGIADNFEKAVLALNRRNYDIVLLDIHLDSETSGIELGKLIQTVYKRPYIFITASQNSHTLEEAISAKPSGYLSKPVTANSLFITIQNALKHFEHHPDKASTFSASLISNPFFYIKHGNGHVKVEWADVVSLSVEQNYTRVLTTQHRNGFLIRSTLQKTLETIVPEAIRPEFLRVNRGEVVRMSFIDELKGQTAITRIKSFSITESFMKEVKQKLHFVS